MTMMNVAQIQELGRIMDEQESLTRALDRLVEIIQERKQLEKEEKELKAMFKDNMEVGEVFETEFALLSLTTKTRENLDRKSLEEEFGKEEIAEFVKKTEYLQVDIKTK